MATPSFSSYIMVGNCVEIRYEPYLPSNRIKLRCINNNINENIIHMEKSRRNQERCCQVFPCWFRHDCCYCDDDDVCHIILRKGEFLRQLIF